MSRLQSLLRVAYVALAVACSAPSNTSSTSQALVCGAPAPVTACETWDAAGLVNVRCPINPCTLAYQTPTGGGGACEPVFADPDDDCDDTTAIQTALARAGSVRTVLLPSGRENVSLPQVATNPYRISSTIDVSGRRIRGQGVAGHNEKGTRIAVVAGVTLSAHQACDFDLATDTLPALANPGTVCKTGAMLAAVSSPTEISALVLQPTIGGATGVAHFGIYLNQADGSLITDVVTRFFSRSGIVMEDSDASLRRIGSLVNETHGIVTANGRVDISASGVQVNKGHGLVVTTRAQTTDTRPIVAVYSFDAEVNGDPQHSPGLCGPVGTQTGRGINVADSHGIVSVRDAWLEGNGLGGFRAARSDHVGLFTSRSMGNCPGAPDPDFAGETRSHAIEFLDCRHCAAVGNTAEAGVEQDDTWQEGNSVYADVRRNIFSSGTPNTLHYTGGNGAGPYSVKMAQRTPSPTKVSFFQHASRHLTSGVEPPLQPPITAFGRMVPGDIVWQGLPVPSSTAAWTCHSQSGANCCNSQTGVDCGPAPYVVFRKLPNLQ